MKRQEIPTPSGKTIHMRDAGKEATCDIHDWPTDGLGRRLVQAMRDRHPRPGVNACRPCIDRAIADVKTAKERAGSA